jgi:hypothetical protein
MRINWKILRAISKFRIKSNLFLKTQKSTKTKCKTLLKPSKVVKHYPGFSLN